jgi:hypothetical protein
MIVGRDLTLINRCRFCRGVASMHFIAQGFNPGSWPTLALRFVGSTHINRLLQII